MDVIVFFHPDEVDLLLGWMKSSGRELYYRRLLQTIAVVCFDESTVIRLKTIQVFPDIFYSPDLKSNDWNQLLLAAQKKKERAAQSWVVSPAQKRVVASSCSRILRACRGLPNDRVPLWLMRQAGRYMAEYHLSRNGLEFLDFCKRSDLAAEATLYAVERLGVDAAIIFADILLLVEPMGLDLYYHKGLGPQITPAVRTLQDVENLRPVDVGSSLGYVLEAIRLVRSQMSDRIPLIGFCGAPFTVASYMVEGKSSKNFIPTKLMMYQNPRAWHLLLDKITTVSIDYLNAQVEAGADLLQIFDSWVGQLSVEEYLEYVFPHSKKLIEGVRQKYPEVPLIHFGTNTDHLLEKMKLAGGDVIGVDTKTNIVTASKRLLDVSIQGNLDPVLLFADQKTLLAQAQKILQAVGSRPGFIFNLGHGILPETPVDNVLALVDFVHQWKVEATDSISDKH